MSAKNFQCSQCGKKAGFLCSGCKLTAYCSKDCYAIHYKASHKVLCKRLSKAKDDICYASLANSTMLASSSGADPQFVARPDREAFVKALCDNLIVHGEMNTSASIAAGLKNVETLLSWSCDPSMIKLFFILLWLFLLDPHPGNLRYCYHVINLDALYNGEVTDVIEPWDAPDRCVKFNGRKYHTTPFHQLPHLILKLLLLADIHPFLTRLDAVLVGKSQWKDPVVIYNILPFLWPQNHCFERKALGARGGKSRLGSVGDVREARLTLNDSFFFLYRMFTHPNGKLLLSLLLSEHAPTECEGRPVTFTVDVEPGSLQETYAVARMYHALLHNKRLPLMEQILEVLEVTARKLRESVEKRTAERAEKAVAANT